NTPKLRTTFVFFMVSFFQSIDFLFLISGAKIYQTPAHPQNNSYNPVGCPGWKSPGTTVHSPPGPASIFPALLRTSWDRSPTRRTWFHDRPARFQSGPTFRGHTHGHAPAG